MKLTRVEAASMHEALWKIRSTMGEEAMIVGTRTLRKGGVLGVGSREVVEVYVAQGQQGGTSRRDLPASRLGDALTSPPAQPRSVVAAPPPERETAGDDPAGADDQKLPPHVEELSRALGNLRQEVQNLASGSRRVVLDHPFLRDAFDILVSHDIDEKFAERIVVEMRSMQLPVGVNDPERVRALVKAQVRKLFLPNVPTAMFKTGMVQVLVGPTGVGKTTTIAKLAARAKINERKRVGLVTLDTFRIAAVDQLQKYARIIGVPIDVVSDPVEFRSAIQRLQREHVDLILVDTAGRGHRDELKMQELREFLSVLPEAEIHLVLSTTTQPRTLEGVAARFVPLGVHRLILTKLDEAESFGSVLSILASVGKPVSFLTDGQNVPDDIMVSDPDRLADLVFRSRQI